MTITIWTFVSWDFHAQHATGLLEELPAGVIGDEL